MTRFSLRASVACFAAVFAFSSPAFAQVFDKPTKQLKGDGIKHLGSSQRVLIPAFYSENLIAGTHKASKGGAHAKVVAANVGITPELGGRIADALLEDLVSKLQSAGLEVILHSDAKDTAGIATAKQWQPHKTHKMPIASIKLGYGAMDYLVSAPAGWPVLQHTDGVLYDPGMAMRFAKAGKEHDAIVLVPTYRFQAPILHGSTNLGINTHYAKVGIVPSMQLVWGGFLFLSPKGAWGSYITNGNDTFTLLEKVGELQKTSESKSSDTSLFSFETFRSMAKSGYLMDIDVEAYFTAAVAAGKELNDHFVGQLR